ncbi:MAG: ABC-2 family transporter protein [Spirochaetales bacterium]|nr:ABC-2 family transporter protein [Spirochaetales bacterium]
MRLFKSIIKQFRVLKAVAFVTYKEWAAYRSHMMVSLIVGPVSFLVQYFIWQAVYSNQTQLNGFTLDQVLSYYALITLTHYLTMDFADWNLHMLIRTGQFITYMIRPMSHRYFAFSQKVGHRVLGFIYEFIPVYLMFFFVFNIKLIPANFFWCGLSIALGFLMTFFINYAIGIIGFWIIRGEGVRRMIMTIDRLFRGVLIPLVFFPDMIQKILFFLPFQFASYVPVRVFIGSYILGGMSFSIPEIVGIQAIAVVIMFFITKILWLLGARKFTGVGV